MRQGAFSNIFFEQNSLNHQTWLTDRFKQGQSFSGIF